MSNSEEVVDVQSFLRQIFTHKRPGRVTAYRGHSDEKYKIQAKIFRYEEAKKNEEKILSELLSESPADFAGDYTVFDKLVRAQHYGLPTRLLDATLNPLAALYFACNIGDDFGPDGEVIRFVVSSDRIKLFDSDTVSCISNFARLSYQEKNALYMLFRAAKGVGGSSSINSDEFNDRQDVKRLVQFIRVEKPYFTNSIDPTGLTKFFFVMPKKANRRILAQSGAFIVSGLLKSLAEETSSAFEISRIKIPSMYKSTILAELDILQINGRSLFPEIENASKYIGDRYFR